MHITVPRRMPVKRCHSDPTASCSIGTGAPLLLTMPRRFRGRRRNVSASKWLGGQRQFESRDRSTTTESVTTTMMLPARRLILAGGFAVAVAVAPAVAVFAGPVDSRRRSRRAPAVNPRTPSPVNACPIWCRIRLRLAKPRPAGCPRLTAFRAREAIPANASVCPRSSRPKRRWRSRTRRSARARNPLSDTKLCRRNAPQFLAPAADSLPANSENACRLYSAFVECCRTS